MKVTCFGATREVTGSCHLLEVAGKKVLLDCGMIQGRAKDEARNREPFPFDVASLDAVVLSHAHIDHSGRLPLLVKSGFTGPIYSHAASIDLCKILLKDSAYINEREVQWENRKRERKGLKLLEPLYSQQDAAEAMQNFEALAYAEPREILPGVTVTLHDAGHIIGSAIVELTLSENGIDKTLVFSGDLGHRGSPILRDYSLLEHADLVMMESTYGDRDHKGWDESFEEVSEIVRIINNSTGNVLIPAFAVGRSQTILYMFAKYAREWQLDRWQIFLDSPMAIEATAVYARHTDLYDEAASAFWQENDSLMHLPNLHYSKTSEQSMKLNRISDGAIIIAGSGMCTGGRIKHHLKHNAWRSNCHIVITGYQAHGTIGRDLVDGKRHIRLWGETIRVAAQVHTIGGLSAHAGQRGLLDWYAGFKNRPRVLLVHGEEEAMEVFAGRLRNDYQAKVEIATHGQSYEI
ncbi:MAG: MBL fold metallo-hydrolase [Gammaproteobacteria bacterium]|nr:MBL fold metallo-hydrolase [Gammaproteobacteria bacterium]